jgi:hypothetical protein
MAGERSEGHALWNAFVSGWPKKVRDALRVGSILPGLGAEREKREHITGK